MHALQETGGTHPSAAEHSPALRLVQDVRPTADAAPGPGGAWILLFGALSASAGHGLFLFCALTRLSKVPSTLEIGGPLAQAVIGWFVASAPLALLTLAARRPFQRLGPRSAWTVAALVALAAATAFVLYLRAVALA
jgi:hypothetical protein